MNNKRTFPELVDSIAELTNTSKRVSELFLKELFGVVKERLEQGESVKIKNLGTFKVTEIAARKSVNVNTGEDMEIPAHRRVSFTPDKILADAINTPFEGFDTVILDDDITEDDLKELATIDNDIVEEKKEVAETKNKEIVPPPFIQETITVEDKKIPEKEPENELIDMNEEVLVKTEIVETKGEEEDNRNEEKYNEERIEPSSIISSNDFTVNENEYEEEVKTEKRKSFIWGFLGGILACIIIGVVAIAVCESCFGDFITHTEVEKVQSDTIVHNTVPDDTVLHKSDTVNVTELEISKVVTDTVRSNYFLTKMSRKYYGRYEFWVYIYEENKAKISNPNKVSPGLVVVIPPKEKYGIDKNDEESVKKAKELAEKIL